MERWQQIESLIQEALERVPRNVRKIDRSVPSGRNVVRVVEER
jgi:hypothetical protein